MGTYYAWVIIAFRATAEDKILVSKSLYSSGRELEDKQA